MKSIHQNSESSHVILPRLLRFRDAPQYLGMDRNKFNADVRLYLTEIPLGKQAIAFDRLELDSWVDHYISCNGRPANPTGERIWDENTCQVSANAENSDTYRSKSRDMERFGKAVRQATSG